MRLLRGGSRAGLAAWQCERARRVCATGARGQRTAPGRREAGLALGRKADAERRAAPARPDGCAPGGGLLGVARNRGEVLSAPLWRFQIFQPWPIVVPKNSAWSIVVQKKIQLRPPECAEWHLKNMIIIAFGWGSDRSGRYCQQARQSQPVRHHTRRGHARLWLCSGLKCVRPCFQIMTALMAD